jgi:hypothetical protein
MEGDVLIEEVLDSCDLLLARLGAQAEEGEAFHNAPLDVLRYYRRLVLLSWLPILGEGLSVVAIVRQPIDVGLASGGYSTLLKRVAMAVNGRFPPWPRGRGASVGLTTVVVTPEPIGPEDDGLLGRALSERARSRIVPLALFRLNLGQEAMAMALAGTPEGLFPEPQQLTEVFTQRFRRFVPLIDSTL